MSQSIYVTLDTLKTETSVPEVQDKDGNVIRKNFGSVAHTLPREHYPTSTIFDNEEQFLEWAQEHGCLLALLQSGINDWLISDRAAFKRMVKGTWTAEIGQTNINDRKWTVSTKPAGALTPAEKATNAISALSPEEIVELIARFS
jgi:hypothetical protein